MFLKQQTINIILFIISLFGVTFSRKNLLIILICIELMLLSLNLNFIILSVYLDDICGQLFSLFILTVAAGESSIGLAVMIAYYRVRGSIVLQKTILKF
jgi:NADH-quinone oxidoreductase subunit K